MTNLQKAIFYVEKQIEHCSAYIWSGQGELLRKLSVIDLVKMETSATNAQRVIKFIWNNLDRIDDKAKAFDCSGLVIKALIYASILPEGYDNTADGLLHKFTRIDIKQRQAGDLCYKLDKSGKAVHVALCINCREVIEAKGRDDGVVRSVIDNSWSACNRPLY